MAAETAALTVLLYPSARCPPNPLSPGDSALEPEQQAGGRMRKMEE